MRRIVGTVDELLYDAGKLGVSPQVFLRVVAVFGFHFNNFIGGKPEYERVFFSGLIDNFNIRAVHRTERKRAVYHKLHIARTGRFKTRSRYLLGNVGCRKDFFRNADAVVFDEHDADFSVHAPVVVDAVGDGIDQFDDRFRPAVARRGFRTEDKSLRRRVEIGIVDDAVIQIHDVQNI